MSTEVRSTGSRPIAVGGRSSRTAGPRDGPRPEGLDPDEPLERRALVNSARLTVALLASWTLALVGRFVLPPVLGTERFGELAFIEGAAVLSLAVMSFGVGGYIHREVAIDASPVRRFARPLRRIQMMTGLAMTAGLAVAFSFASGGEQALIALVFGLGQMAIVLSRVDASYLQAVHDVRAETSATIVTKAIWFALLIGLLGAGAQMMALPVAIVVSETVRAVWLRRAMLAKFGRLRRGRHRSGLDVIVKSLPYFLNALNVMFLGYSVRVLVGLLSTKEVVGLLASAEVAIAVPMLLTPVIAQVSLPMLSALVSRGRRLVLRRTTQIIDVMAVPVTAGCVVLFALSDELMTLAFGDEYTAAGLAFGLLALSVPATYFTQVAGVAMMATGRAWQNTRINLYTMLLVVAMAIGVLVIAPTDDPGHLTAWAAATLVVGEWVTVLALVWVQPLAPLRRPTTAALVVLAATAAGIAAVGRDPSDPAWLALSSVAVLTAVVGLPRTVVDIRTVLQLRNEADGGAGTGAQPDGDAEPGAHIDAPVEVDDGRDERVDHVARDDEPSAVARGDEVGDGADDDEWVPVDDGWADPVDDESDDDDWVPVDDGREDTRDVGAITADDAAASDGGGSATLSRGSGRASRANRPGQDERGRRVHRVSNLDEPQSEPRPIRSAEALDSPTTTGGHMDLMAARESDATTAGGSSGPISETTTRLVEQSERRSGRARERVAVLRPADADDEVSLFSVTPLRRWARYTLGAVRQHKFLFVVVFVPALLGVGMFLAASPPNYQTSATVLLAGDDAIGGVEGATFAASRQASSVIVRQDSLDRMISQLGLAENRAEPPFFGQLSERIFGAPTGADLHEDLRDQLRASIFVSGNESAATIDIAVLWPDPHQAVEIAGLSYEIFLEDRERTEIEPHERRVEILTGQAARANAAVDALRDDLKLDPVDGGATGSELDTQAGIAGDLTAQLREAEIDLDEARAGVPLRYALNAQPELPTAPLAGNLVLYVATLMAAVIAATSVAFWRERPRGRVVAAWQLERLGRPIVTTGPLTQPE